MPDQPTYDFNDPLFRQRPHLIRLAKDHLSLVGLNEDLFDWEVVKTTDLGIPVVYHIHYRLRSIVGIDENTHPVYGDHHIAELSLDRPYPLEPCKVYMKTDVWHPNIKWDGKLKGRVCSNVDKLGISFDLYALVWWVAEILQYKNYHAKNEPPYPEDINVAEWVLNFAEPRDIVNKYKGIYIEQNGEYTLRQGQASETNDPARKEDPKEEPEDEDDRQAGQDIQTSFVPTVQNEEPEEKTSIAIKPEEAEIKEPEKEEPKQAEEIAAAEEKPASHFKISILKKAGTGPQENSGIKITPRTPLGNS